MCIQITNTGKDGWVRGRGFKASLQGIIRDLNSGRYEIVPTLAKDGKVAKIVTISLMTRVIVPENATEEEVVEASKAQFIDQIHNEIFENVDEVYLDEVVPFGEGFNE